MDIKEFNDVATSYLHGDDELILDVRPFGARQGEAIDSYLRNWLVQVCTSEMGNTNRLVVLLCDSTVEIPASARVLVETLASSGQFAEIRHACSAKAFAMAG